MKRVAVVLSILLGLIAIGVLIYGVVEFYSGGYRLNVDGIFEFAKNNFLLFLLWVSSLWQVMFGLVGLSMSKEDSEAGEAVVQLVFSPIMSIFAGTATIITLFIVGLIISLVVFLYHFAGEGIPGVVCIVLAVLMLLSAGAKPASEVIVVIFRR